MKYSVYFVMYERWWYRFDVEADTPEEAFDEADATFCRGEEPDDEIYDQVMGPFSAEVEEDTGKVVLKRGIRERP